jgi:hypothetical protein
VIISTGHGFADRQMEPGAGSRVGGLESLEKYVVALRNRLVDTHAVRVEVHNTRERDCGFCARSHRGWTHWDRPQRTLWGAGGSCVCVGRTSRCRSLSRNSGRRHWPGPKLGLSEHRRELYRCETLSKSPKTRLKWRRLNKSDVRVAVVEATQIGDISTISGACEHNAFTVGRLVEQSEAFCVHIGFIANGRIAPVYVPLIWLSAASLSLPTSMNTDNGSVRLKPTKKRRAIAVLSTTRALWKAWAKPWKLA